jgi:hypothetical protein
MAEPRRKKRKTGRKNLTAGGKYLPRSEMAIGCFLRLASTVAHSEAVLTFDATALPRRVLPRWVFLFCQELATDPFFDPFFHEDDDGAPYRGEPMAMWLHHPGNTVPACSACNGSRDQAADGSRLTWEQHLAALGQLKGWTSATIERRRKRIQNFVDNGGYPTLTPEEMAYLRRTAQALYQDILERSTAGARGFVAIHGEAAVRI